MSKFLSTSNPIFAAIEQVIDVAYLSILWLIFSIPVITIGASTTALYYTATKVIRHRRGYMFREFWRGFKSNFKQSTCIWLIYLAGILVLLADIRIMKLFGGGTVINFMQYSFAMLMVILTAIVIYALAYTARFEQTMKRILLNSVLMAVRHLPWTLLMLVVLAAAVFFVYIMGIAFVLAPAIAALLNSMILERIFVQYMSEEDRKKEELRNHPEQFEYMNREE